jgi:DNA-binding NtrC family response regulator
MEDLEKRVITEILEQTHSNLSEAARMLRIPRRTLRRRIEKYQI